MGAAPPTAPFYGFELKLFPFAAKRRGMMHLRLGTVPPLKILANLPGLWNGTWFPEGVLDFHASDVNIHFARPMPFQISGDAEGYREDVRLQVSPEPIEVVDFTGTVN
jgi:diacylglycerol kinase family enzyme